VLLVSNDDWHFLAYSFEVNGCSKRTLLHQKQSIFEGRRLMHWAWLTLYPIKSRLVHFLPLKNVEEVRFFQVNYA
jgi:hypothetical protein